MIELQRLTKVYRGGQLALNDVSAKLTKKVTAVIGRNGAGKTTLMRILSTQLLPTSGTATINGFDILRDKGKIRKFLVSVPQEGRPIGMLTPFEHLRIYLTARGMSFSDATEAARKALKELELWEFRDRPADMLSGGMKRKLFVAMAIAAGADYVFLDEPTTGLDPLSRIEVWAAIKELRADVLLTTHYMEEAVELSEEIVFMDGGKIIAQGELNSLLEGFKGMIRVESSSPVDGWMRVGNIYFTYASADEAEAYLKKGFSIKQITLEDLFIRHGVMEIEP